MECLIGYLGWNIIRCVFVVVVLLCKFGVFNENNKKLIS